MIAITYSLELVEGPRMRLSRPIARKVSGGDVSDSLSIDANDLECVNGGPGFS